MWTDAKPMLNISSFVTTFTEPERKQLMADHMHVNYIDHGVYPKSYDLEAKMVKLLHNFWNGPTDVCSSGRRSRTHREILVEIKT